VRFEETSLFSKSFKKVDFPEFLLPIMNTAGVVADILLIWLSHDGCKFVANLLDSADTIEAKV